MKKELLEEKLTELVEVLNIGNIEVAKWLSSKLLSYVQEAVVDPVSVSLPRNTYPKTMAGKEKQIIEEALVKNAGFRKETADELGMSERTLYRKLKKYGIDG